jgi:flagellum-specific peptidoglycan hydrolase FlgJ
MESKSTHQNTLSLQALADALHRNWFNGVLLGLGIYILFFKNISIQFNLNSIEQPVAVAEQGIMPSFGQALPANYKAEKRASTQQNVSQIKWDTRQPEDFPNLTFVLNDNYAERHHVRPEVMEAVNAKVEAYLEQYKMLAISEMEDYGIPASITLAQGLLESNAGESLLARESNNHFGIKCKSKCRGCTCRNYSDDDLYDMFRVFGDAKESFRAHSELLNGDRYKHLHRLRISDYKGWAHGLKKAGYATDKAYADKLIRIIEQLDLTRFDRLGA